MQAWDRFALTPRHDSMDTVRDADKEIRRKHEVRLSGDTRDAPVRDKTLLDVYASEEEIESVRATHDQIAVAEKAVTTIQTALTAVNEQIVTAQRACVLDTDRAAAIALGEPDADL